MESRRVFIVDDRDDNAGALGLLLELKGYEVFIATDGPAAIAAARAQRPDAILLDLGLPGLSGYDVCRRFRAEPWGKEVLIIAVTGWTKERDRAKAGEAGFDFYLIKPVQIATVETLLKGNDSAADGILTVGQEAACQ